MERLTQPFQCLLVGVKIALIFNYLKERLEFKVRRVTIRVPDNNTVTMKKLYL